MVVVSMRSSIAWNMSKLSFVLDERVFLAVADETYPLLQVVDGEQVILPLRVDDVEHDDALVSAHRLGPDLRLFGLVRGLRLLPDDFLNLARRQLVEVNPLGLGVEGVGRLKLDFEVLNVPVVGRGVGGQVLADE